MLKRRVFLMGAFAFLAGPSNAEDLYEMYLNSVSKKPFVTFLARGGVPGHSYVGFGVELDNGLRFYEELLGFYPKGGWIAATKSAATPVDGQLDYRIKDIVWDVEHIVFPSVEKFALAKAVAAKWQSDSPQYSLLANDGKNCSVFAAEVAKSLDLKIPNSPGGKLPKKFMTELRDKN